jgi:thermitase
MSALDPDPCASRRILALVAGAGVALALGLAGFAAAPGNAQENEGGEVRKDHNSLAPAIGAPSPGQPVSVLGPLDEDPDGFEYVAGELLVSYGSDRAEKARRGNVKESFDGIDAQLLAYEEVKKEKDRKKREGALAAKKRELEAEPGVESVSYNYVQRDLWTPDDYHFAAQAGNDGGQYQLRETVKAPLGWDYPSSRGGSVKIAVVDSGFDETHPEFCTSYTLAGACSGGKVVAQKDFLRDDPYADDEQTSYGHGTRVASIASARTNNANGIAGAAPNAQLMIAKVSDASGRSTIADSTAAVLWAADNGARVINLSVGGGPYNVAYEDALDYAYRTKSALPICAAGGGGADGVGDYTTSLYPAQYASCMAVGSSVGVSKSTFSPYGPYIDVVAPGEALLSAQPRSAGANYSWSTGTSFAAPVVSGLAADVTSRNPSLTAAQVKATIERYADDLGAAGEDDYFGRGRVNFQRAIANAPNQ